MGRNACRWAHPLPYVRRGMRDSASVLTRCIGRDPRVWSELGIARLTSVTPSWLKVENTANNSIPNPQLVNPKGSRTFVALTFAISGLLLGGPAYGASSIAGQVFGAGIPIANSTVT